MFSCACTACVFEGWLVEQYFIHGADILYVMQAFHCRVGCDIVCSRVYTCMYVQFSY